MFYILVAVLFSTLTKLIVLNPKIKKPTAKNDGGHNSIVIFAVERTIKLKEKRHKSLNILKEALCLGPSDWSRTSGLLNPIQARYQTAPHPEN